MKGGLPFWLSLRVAVEDESLGDPWELASDSPAPGELSGGPYIPSGPQEVVPLQGLPPPPARSVAHPSTQFDPAALPCGLRMAPPPLGPPWPIHSLLRRQHM